ncbi:MAG: TPM domain-containing protein [Elusimicrobiota bacterium]
MKKRHLLILLLSCLFIGAAFPSPKGYVNDYAGIISSQTKDAIHSLAYELEQKSGAQLAVVIVKDLDGMDVESYAWQLFEKWGIGKKGKDTGVLLLVSPSDRKVRIEVGYGFEGAIPDSRAGEIIRTDIIPYFKQGNMDQGILRGSLVLLKLMSEEMGVPISGKYRLPEKAERKTSPLAVIFNIIFILLILSGRMFFFPLFIGGYGRGHYSSGGGGFGGFGGVRRRDVRRRRCERFVVMIIL